MYLAVVNLQYHTQEDPHLITRILPLLRLSAGILRREEEEGKWKEGRKMGEDRFIITPQKQVLPLSLAHPRLIYGQSFPINSPFLKIPGG